MSLASLIHARQCPHLSFKPRHFSNAALSTRISSSLGKLRKDGTLPWPLFNSKQLSSLTSSVQPLKATNKVGLPRPAHTAVKHHEIPHAPSFGRPPPPPPSSSSSSHRQNSLQLEQEPNLREDKPIDRKHIELPKSSLANFFQIAFGQDRPAYDVVEVSSQGRRKRSTNIYKCTITIPLETPLVVEATHLKKSQATHDAALSAVKQLHSLGILENAKLLRKTTQTRELATRVRLSDNTAVEFQVARQFMDYYCRKYGFRQPDLQYNSHPSAWEAVMTVGGRRIGLGYAPRKSDAERACYLDVVKYLEECDPGLWKEYVEARKMGTDLGPASKLYFSMSNSIDDQIRDLCASLERSVLYRNQPHASSITATQVGPTRRKSRPASDAWLTAKSRILMERRQEYLKDPAMQKMRSTRFALPVYTKANELLDHIRDNEVTICMAATGSGKTTQIPQMILDSFIDKGEGSRCNIICTQPRRLAAISVADRVAQERGEVLGKSVGFQVRFDRRLPEDHGSITYCTIGTFLKRMHEGMNGDNVNLDSITHIIVDEVHERSIDTDLLLVVLRRIMEDRRARKKPLKVILMSATIDPTLFQDYFTTENGGPAKTIDIPGRSFPVTQSYLDDFLPKIVQGPQNWVLGDEPAARYIAKELGQAGLASLRLPVPADMDEIQDRDLELPHTLVAATISHVLDESSDGHVLVFLPGWDDILAVKKVLESPPGPFTINFNDTAKYSIHLLHSTIPLADQKVIFTPPPKGVRRIILATNIAETSVTIPDVVYVVDSAKVKEQQYDSARRITSLVSSWIGRSNLAQRAGRAGRHRPGEYYGILSRHHAKTIPSYQTVEMERIDLSNVVMHIKALNFPDAVENVLAAAIEPPLPERVAHAILDLRIAGALDEYDNLTSLGKLLLQLPVDVRMGRLILYGCFFRCLDSALTIAALLSARDPFMSPLLHAKEAAAKKRSWAPRNFPSDTFAALQAYNVWAEMFMKGHYAAANRFCSDNFLSKPTLLTVHRTRKQILRMLEQLGVMDLSAGASAQVFTDGGVPVELNANRDSLPLLSGLMAIALQSKVGVRTGNMSFRVADEKGVLIHPKSVNFSRKANEASTLEDRQLIAFTEKRRNSPISGSPAQTYMVNTTPVDPLMYVLFGTSKVRLLDDGLECDDWLPIVGNLDSLEDLQRLKALIDSCMLRVFEGIHSNLAKRSVGVLGASKDELEIESEETQTRDLSPGEIRELNLMTHDIVGILNNHSEDRIASLAPDLLRSPATARGSRSVENYDAPTFGVELPSFKRKERRF